MIIRHVNSFNYFYFNLFNYLIVLISKIAINYVGENNEMIYYSNQF